MKIIKNDDEKYCKIFVDSGMKKNDLLDVVTRFMKGKKKHTFSVYNDYVHIFFKINEEADEEMKRDAKDGFLFYQYIFEVYSEPGIDFKTYIEYLKKLIDFLRYEGIKVIPVCYFDDLLIDGKNSEDYLNSGKNYTDWI